MCGRSLSVSVNRLANNRAQLALDAGVLIGATPEMLSWLSNNAAGMIDYHKQQLQYWQVRKCHRRLD